MGKGPFAAPALKTGATVSRKQYEAELEDGTRILSRRYGEGWSEAEAWGHFCHEVWKRARAAGSATVVMGDRFGTCLKREVPDSGTMLGARRLPGTFRLT